MHAILGLAASDLSSAQRQPGLVASAMDHRVKAIKAIKKTLSDARRADTFEEGDALMATCFALTFQSVLLDDGMAEYMTFIRGVVIVATQMYVTGANLLFGQFLGGAKQAEVLRPLLERVPLVEHAWAAEAVAAVEGLEPLCRHPVERQYHERILEMARQLQVSSWGGKYTPPSFFSPVYPGGAKGAARANPKLQRIKQCPSTTGGGWCFRTSSSAT